MLLRPEVSATVSQATLITGAARSGTTIVGTLVHSLQGLDYVFEPPFLFALLPLIDTLDPAVWRSLYETYLFEDFLMDSLAGRRLNFNQQDESSVFRAKTVAEIENRIKGSSRRNDVFWQAQRTKIAYKMPDIVPYVSKLKSYYPAMKVIVLFREPEAVVDSLVKRGWFQTDASASERVQGPWKAFSPDMAFWVPNGTEQQWRSASSLERAYLYYNWAYEPLLLLNPANVLVVNYDNLVSYPAREFERVRAYVGAPAGSLTEKVVASIKEPPATTSRTLCLMAQSMQERTLRLVNSIEERHNCGAN